MTAWRVMSAHGTLGSGVTRLAALASALRAHPWLGEASYSEALARGVRVTRVCGSIGMLHQMVDAYARKNVVTL